MPRGKKGTSKRRFLDGYTHYDPTVDGYGNPAQWRSAFRVRMGLDEAREELKNDKPWDILHVPHGATWDQIRAAYRAACKQWHPDLNPHQREKAEAMMKRINAAYTLLEHEYGKG